MMIPNTTVELPRASLSNTTLITLLSARLPASVANNSNVTSVHFIAMKAGQPAGGAGGENYKVIYSYRSPSPPQAHPGSMAW